jgi:Fe-S cluster assembly protein SufD
MGNLSKSSQAFIEQNGATEFSCSEPWLEQLRKSGLDNFSINGLPTPSKEEWKYTSLKALDRIGTGDKSVVNLEKVDFEWLPAALESHKLVFVNGRFDKNMSEIGSFSRGIRVEPLSEMLRSEPAMLQGYLGRVGSIKELPVLALNTAFIEDGFVIVIENAVLDKPIEVIYISQGNGNTAYHPRNLVVAKDSASVTILERNIGIGDGAYLINNVSEIIVDDESSVKFYRLLEDSIGGVNLSTVETRVGKRANFNSFILSIGGRMSRSEIHVACQAEGAETNLNGVYMACADQNMDHTTLIEHLVPNTTSNENYKGVLDDQARGVFQGSIVVSDGADGTDGRMSNKTLLLSDDAEIDAKPQLEIYADDVQCAHGFTAGELDEEALFYLRSRGIPDVMARSMLVEGFLTEVIDSGVDEEFRNVFIDKVSEWMDR